jgi:preprotein translocase subunit SecD
MKPRFLLWFIIVLIISALWLNVPHISQVPDNLALFGRTISLQGVPSKMKDMVPNLTGKFPIKLGLDLQGGTQLILDTDMSKIAFENRDAALESARGVIEKRVNLYGVSEAVVQSSKVGDQRRILVELPGVKDSSAAANLVGRTAQLDFREIPASQSAEATESAIAAILSAQSTGLTGADLKKAQVVFGQGTKAAAGPEVQIDFTTDGAKKFAEITKRNIGKPLVIFLDENPIQAPTVQAEIIGGSAVISGGFTPEGAKDLAVQLNAGALPVPIHILEQRTIGATLGDESIHRSVIAGIIGIATILIFMVAYYGVYGLIADLALLIYILLSLAIIRTGLFLIPPVTLTLAGIAGFILSIGMAVDANILIFERMKEESRSGKSGASVLRLGFSRAWTSIRDSNISSLITATILFILGTSVVRGFALTLAIGVLVSMFSAITVTRTFLRLLPRFRK